MNVVGNCPLCEEHALHIIGEKNLKSQQCINCGYVTSEKFKLSGVKKEEHQEFKNLTEDMKGWVKVENDRVWIPTIMTLPIGMLYPQNIDNMVNHKTEMKWYFAEMIKISENEKEKYPIEGQEGKFYERRIDTDNAKVYETFLEGMVEVNNRLKQKKEPEPLKIKLPKLKKVDGE